MSQEGILARGCMNIKSDANDTHCCSTQSCSKLNTYDWLNDLELAEKPNSLVEIRFKNTRKGIYRNVNDLPLKIGDIVVFGNAGSYSASSHSQFLGFPKPEEFFI